MPSFFLSRTPTHQFLLLICDSYMSWSTRFVSLKLFVEFFIFDSMSSFLKFIFFSTKCMDFWTLKRHNSIQSSKNRKATQSFAPRPLVFKLQQEVLTVNDMCVSWSSPKTELVTNILNPDNQSFENVSTVTFK